MGRGTDPIADPKKIIVFGRTYGIDSNGEAHEKLNLWRTTLRRCFGRCFGYREVREREREVTAALRQRGNPMPITTPKPAPSSEPSLPSILKTPSDSDTPPQRPLHSRQVRFSEQVQACYFDMTDREQACKVAMRAESCAKGAKHAAKCAGDEAQSAAELTEAVAIVASLEAARARGGARAQELALTATAMATEVARAKEAVGRANLAAEECRAFAQQADLAYQCAENSSNPKDVSQAANRALMKADQAASAEERALEAQADTERASTKVGNLAVAAGVASPAR